MTIIDRVKSLGSLTRLNEGQRNFLTTVLGSFRVNMFGMTQRNFIDKSFEQNVDVYSVISKIIATSRNARWIVERRKRGTTDEWEEITDTSVHELMSAPNVSKGYTWEDIVSQTLVYLLAGGNGLNLGMSSRDNGPIDELDILPNRFVKINTTKDWFDPVEDYTFEIEQFRATFTKSEIKHFKLFNPGYNTIQESVWGLSPIQVASKVVKVGNDRWDADAALLENRGAIGMITQKTGPEGYPMTKEDVDSEQEYWNSQTAGTHNFGKIKVSNKDLRFVKLAMSSADLQLIEKGVVNLRAICNVLGVDSSIFNDPANKTFNNRKEAEKSLYQDAVIPMNDILATGYTSWLIPTHFPNSKGSVRMRADFSNVPVLQDDINEKTKNVTAQKLAGIITANEARDSLGQLASEDDNADKLIVSTSNVLLEDVGGAKE